MNENIFELLLLVVISEAGKNYLIILKWIVLNSVSFRFNTSFSSVEGLTSWNVVMYYKNQASLKRIVLSFLPNGLFREIHK